LCVCVCVCEREREREREREMPPSKYACLAKLLYHVLIRRIEIVRPLDHQ